MTAEERWQYIELRWHLSIVGAIRDALTQAPIVGARVDVASGPGDFERKRKILSQDPAWTQQTVRMDRTVSQADGIFKFVKLPPGDYQLAVTAPPPSSRYVVTWQDVRVASTRDIDGRVQLDFPTIELKPTQIRGHIIDATTRQGIGGATIQLRGGAESSVTDQEGKYLLSHLTARRPKLEVLAPKYQTVTRPIDLTEGIVELDIELQLQMP